MELSNNVIKQGLSDIGDFKVFYSIVMDSDNKVIKIDAQIKRKATEASTEVYMGAVSYTDSRYSFQLTSAATTDERKSLIDEFETVIAELVK